MSAQDSEHTPPSDNSDADLRTDVARSVRERMPPSTSATPTSTAPQSLHPDPQVQVAHLRADVDRRKIDADAEIARKKIESEERVAQLQTKLKELEGRNAAEIERIKTEANKAIAAETKVERLKARGAFGVALVTALGGIVAGWASHKSNDTPSKATETSTAPPPSASGAPVRPSRASTPTDTNSWKAPRPSLNRPGAGRCRGSEIVYPRYSTGQPAWLSAHLIDIDDKRRDYATKFAEINTATHPLLNITLSDGGFDGDGRMDGFFDFHFSLAQAELVLVEIRDAITDSIVYTMVGQGLALDAGDIICNYDGRTNQSSQPQPRSKQNLKFQACVMRGPRDSPAIPNSRIACASEEFIW